METILSFQETDYLPKPLPAAAFSFPYNLHEDKLNHRILRNHGTIDSQTIQWKENEKIKKEKITIVKKQAIAHNLAWLRQNEFCKVQLSPKTLIWKKKTSVLWDIRRHHRDKSAGYEILLQECWKSIAEIFDILHAQFRLSEESFQTETLHRLVCGANGHAFTDNNHMIKLPMSPSLGGYKMRVV